MTVLVILLIWGPIDYSWPAWFAIRLGYLILIPSTLWAILQWIWYYWQPAPKTESLLERVLYGIIGVFLITIAIFKGTAKTHWGNTKWIQNHDSTEAVGNDVLLPGLDYNIAIIFSVIGILVIWFGAVKKQKSSR